MAKEPPPKNEVIEEGAPAWVVTFGDLMSLLLCFFVLLLSFSEMDRQKYKEVAGSLAQAFGVQRKEKVTQSPRGQRIVARAFDKAKLATREREKIGRQLTKEIQTRFKGLKDLVKVEVGEKKITIRMMGETAFDSGRAYLRKAMLPLLKKIASVLKDSKGEIIISGHTDNVPVAGRFRSNLHLSAERAVKVGEYLSKEGQIDPHRISTVGYGEYRPLKSNETEEGRRKNRRVEIVLKSPSSDD